MKTFGLRLLALALLPGLLSVASAFAEATFTTHDSRHGIVYPDIKSVAIDGRGVVWVSSKTSGVGSFNGTAWTWHNQGGMAAGSVKDIAVDRDGNPWFATSGGVMKYDGAVWSTITTAQGLPNDDIQAVTVGPDNALWISWFNRTSGGVSRLANNAWTYYDRNNSGLGDIQIFSILIDRNGHLWFGTKSAGAKMFDGTNWTTYNSPNFLKSNEVRQIVQDSNDVMWFATRGGGVTRFDGENWTTFTLADGLSSNSVWAMALDSVGNLWCATYASPPETPGGGGVCKFDGERWTVYTISDGLAHNVTNGIAIDSLGRRWIGTDAGVSLMTGEREPLPPPSCDFNGDGRTGLADVLDLTLRLRSGTVGLEGDYNGDGRVNLADVSRLLRNIMHGDCP